MNFPSVRIHLSTLNTAPSMADLQTQPRRSFVPQAHRGDNFATSGSCGKEQHVRCSKANCACPCHRSGH